MLKSKAPSTAKRRTYGKQREIKISEFSGVATGFRKFRAPSNRVVEVPREKVLLNPTIAEVSVPDQAIYEDQCRTTSESSTSKIPNQPDCSQVKQSSRENYDRNWSNNVSPSISKSFSVDVPAEGAVSQAEVKSAHMASKFQSNSSEHVHASSKTNRHKLRLKQNPQQNLGRQPLSPLSAYEPPKNSLEPEITSLLHNNQVNMHYGPPTLYPPKKSQRLRPEEPISLPKSPTQSARDICPNARLLSSHQLEIITATDAIVNRMKSSEHLNDSIEDEDNLINTPDEDSRDHVEQNNRRLCKKRALASASPGDRNTNEIMPHASVASASAIETASSVERPLDLCNPICWTAPLSEPSKVDAAKIVGEPRDEGKKEPLKTTKKKAQPLSGVARQANTKKRSSAKQGQSSGNVCKPFSDSKTNTEVVTKAVRGDCENCNVSRNGTFINGCSCSKSHSVKILKRALLCPKSKKRTNSGDSESKLWTQPSNGNAERLAPVQEDDTFKTSNKTPGSVINAAELLVLPEPTELCELQSGSEKKRPDKTKQSRKTVKKNKRPRATSSSPPKVVSVAHGMENAAVQGPTNGESGHVHTVESNASDGHPSLVMPTTDLTSATWFCAGCSEVHKEDLCNAVWPFKKKCGWVTHGVPKDGDCFYSSICKAVAMSTPPISPPPASEVSDPLEAAGNTKGSTSSGSDNANRGSNYDISKRTLQNSSHASTPPLGGQGLSLFISGLMHAHLPLTVAELRKCVAAAVTEEQLRFYQIFATANPQAEWLDFVRAKPVATRLDYGARRSLRHLAEEIHCENIANDDSRDGNSCKSALEETQKSCGPSSGFDSNANGSSPNNSGKERLHSTTTECNDQRAGTAACLSTSADKDASEVEGAAGENGKNGGRRRGHWRGARAFGYADFENSENDRGLSGSRLCTVEAEAPSAHSRGGDELSSAKASSAAIEPSTAGKRPLRRAVRTVNYVAEKNRRDSHEEWEEWPWEALCPEAADMKAPSASDDPAKSTCTTAPSPTAPPSNPATPQMNGASGSGTSSMNSRASTYSSSSSCNSLAKQRPRRAAAKALVSTVSQLQAFVRLSGAEVGESCCLWADDFAHHVVAKAHNLLLLFVDMERAGGANPYRVLASADKPNHAIILKRQGPVGHFVFLSFNGVGLFSSYSVLPPAAKVLWRACPELALLPDFNKTPASDSNAAVGIGATRLSTAPQTVMTDASCVILS